MNKRKQATKILLGPVPPALIACGNAGAINIITLAWVGVVNSAPPMVSAAVRPQRHSHGIIRDSKEFTVNLPNREQVDLVDGCGTLSGRNVDKFKRFNLTAEKGVLSQAPMIAECPVSMECRVEHVLELGSHTLFIGRVVSTFVAEDVLGPEGSLDLARCNLLGFFALNYLETAPLNLKLGYTFKK